MAKFWGVKDRAHGKLCWVGTGCNHVAYFDLSNKVNILLIYIDRPLNEICTKLSEHLGQLYFTKLTTQNQVKETNQAETAKAFISNYIELLSWFSDIFWFYTWSSKQ